MMTAMRPTKRDEKILRFLGLNCVASHDLLRRRFFETDDAARSWINRMRKNGYIESHEFPSDKRVYYYLLRKGTTYVEKTLGGVVVSAVKKITKDKPLGQVGLFRRLAFLEYCTPPEGPLLEPFKPVCDEDSFPDVVQYKLETGEDPFDDLLFCRDSQQVCFVTFYRNKREFIEQDIFPRVWKISTFSQSFELLMRARRFFVPIIVIDEEQLNSVRNQITQLEDKTLFRGFRTAYLPSAASVLPRSKLQGANA